MRPSLREAIAVIFQARYARTSNGWSYLVPYLGVIGDAGSLFAGCTLGERATLLRGRLAP
jgi:hypothetical protein